MFLGFKVLSMLAFSLLVTPASAFAVTVSGQFDNPTPYVSFISPNSSNNNAGANVVVSIIGNGFTPSSIARVNGSNRATIFIDNSHLLVRLYPGDTVNTDGFYVNVFNRPPGGGYSNSEFFTVNTPESTTSNNNPSYKITKNATTTENNNAYSNTNSSENSNQTQNTTSADADDANFNTSNLASAAILGAPGTFLPSGLIQWVMLAIIILLLVIFIRKIFGASKRYHETPLKSP